MDADHGRDGFGVRVDAVADNNIMRESKQGFPRGRGAIQSEMPNLLCIPKKWDA